MRDVAADPQPAGQAAHPLAGPAVTVAGGPVMRERTHVRRPGAVAPRTGPGAMNGSPIALVHRPPAPQELEREHGAMLRLLGGLQQRMDEVGRQHLREVRQLQAEALRLRAELVLLRTRVSWGLGMNAGLRQPRSVREPGRPPLAPRTNEAQAVICQTGCVGHAHPWLEADGQCRRSGQACERRHQGQDSETG